jgi:hypothetical protein
MLDDDTRRAYASRVRGYLIWLDTADIDGDPLTQPHARDGAVRDYRSYLQTVAKRKPSTISTTLAAIGDLYLRLGLGAPDLRRLDLPQAASRALSERDTTRWLRTVERWVNPRDRGPTVGRLLMARSRSETGAGSVRPPHATSFPTA